MNCIEFISSVFIASGIVIFLCILSKFIVESNIIDVLSEIILKTPWYYYAGLASMLIIIGVLLLRS